MLLCAFQPKRKDKRGRIDGISVFNTLVIYFIHEEPMINI